MPNLAPLVALAVWSPAAWALAALAAFCIGLSKTGFGGISLVSVAIMAQLLPSRESTGVILPLLLFADAFAIQAFRKHAVWAEVWRVLPAALLGVATGAWVMHAFAAPGSDVVFRRVIGGIVLALTALQFARHRGAAWLARLRAGRALAWPMGALAGLTTMLANAAGPVMTLYLLAVRLPKYEFVGTSAWIFLLLNLSKLPFSYGLGLIHADSLRLNLLLAPAVAAGALTGRWLLGLAPQRVYEGMLLGFSLLAGLRLLWG